MSDFNWQDVDWSRLTPVLDPRPAHREGSIRGGLDLLKSNTDIVELYRKWIPKAAPVDNGGREVQVSCPTPQHADVNPSASLNRDKGAWTCYGCGASGDAMHLYAIHLGIPYPDRKSKEWADLLEAALVDVGADVAGLRRANQRFPRESNVDSENTGQGATTTPSVPPNEAQAPPELPSRPPSRNGAGVGGAPEAPGREAAVQPVDPVSAFQDSVDQISELGQFDWRQIAQDYPDSFLDRWMQATHPASVPDSFLFFAGLQLIGLAVGRNCYLAGEWPVYPNLLLVMLGDTGSGKTKAVRYATSVLREAMPFDQTTPSTKGVKILDRPASGEVLLEQFQWFPDNTPNDVHPVKALVDVDEMSELMGAARRRGASLREKVISLADGRESMNHATRSADPIEVVDPFLAMVVGAQPDRLGDILGEEDKTSGFANRFIYVSGKKPPRRAWHDRPVIKTSHLGLPLQQIRSWAETQKSGPDGGSIDMDQAAADIFDDMGHEIDAIVASGQNGAMFARADLHAMKMIVILCANAGITIADSKILGHVKTLIGSLYESTAQVAEAAGTSEMNWYIGRILHILERNADGGKPLTRKGIQRHITPGRRDEVKIQNALHQMSKVGLIAQVTHAEDQEGNLVPLGGPARWAIKE